MKNRIIIVRNLAIAAVLIVGVAFCGWATPDREQSTESSSPAETMTAPEEGPNWGWATPDEYEADTGNRIGAFQESPSLSSRVAAGELPRVELRLPEEPQVDRPYEGVGNYGGTIRMAMQSMATWHPSSQQTIEYMLCLDRTGREVVPNIAKGWDFSDGGKTFDLHLREGMKWSDGQPFTAQDVLFYWDAVVMNDDITPVKPNQWMPGGELMTVQAVDENTVSFQFGEPYWTVTYRLGSVAFSGGQNNIFLPKHALEQYHADYNPDAGELAVEEGFEHWWELFNEKRRFDAWLQPNIDIPSVGPWTTSEILPEGVIYERNPFYFKIDTAGNQLPYIDTVKAIPFTDPQTLVLKMIAGEYDYMDFAAPKSADYTVLKEGEEQGEYNVWLIQSLRGNDTSYFFNQNYTEDPAVGEILRDVRFRRALSMAIDREEINEVFFLGKGTPRQTTVHPTVSFYKEEWGDAYGLHRPDEANALLDEMGMEWDADHEWRLRPDGEPFQMVITCIAYHMGLGVELIKEYWDTVGIQTSIREVEFRYLNQIWASREYLVSAWDFGNTAEAAVAIGGLYQIYAGQWAPLWQTWWNTDGAEGEEPPEEVQTIFSLYDQVPYMPDTERLAALTQIFDIWAENVWLFGIVGMVPYPAIVHVDLGNVNTDTYTGPSVAFGNFNRLYQAYWKR